MRKGKGMCGGAREGEGEERKINRKVTRKGKERMKGKRKEKRNGIGKRKV